MSIMKMKKQYQKKEDEKEQEVVEVVVVADSDTDAVSTSTNDDESRITNNQRKIEDTVTDKKFLQGAGVDFLAEAVTRGVNHFYDKKKHKKEEKQRLAEGKRRRKME